MEGKPGLALPRPAPHSVDICPGNHSASCGTAELRDFCYYG